MGYNYEDSKGWIAIGPNISGMGALFDELVAHADPNNYPEMYKLKITGITNSPQLLKGEAARLAAKTKDKNVKDLLLKMSRAAAKA